jgi:hypothetical protein
LLRVTTTDFRLHSIICSNVNQFNDDEDVFKLPSQDDSSEDDGDADDCVNENNPSIEEYAQPTNSYTETVPGNYSEFGVDSFKLYSNIAVLAFASEGQLPNSAGTAGNSYDPSANAVAPAVNSYAQLAGAEPSVDYRLDINRLAKEISENDRFFDNDKAITEKLRTLSTTSKGYRNSQTSLAEHFFATISVHPQLQDLSQVVEDPSNSKKLIRKFFLLIGGAPTPSKKTILNSCLLFFYRNLRKKKYEDLDMSIASVEEIAASRYEMSSIATFNKSLFSFFHRSDVYIHAKDMNIEGSFQAFLKNEADVTSKLRPEYGQLKQAPVDPNALEKLRASDYKIDGSCFNDLLEVLVFQLNMCFALRGKKEVISLMRSVRY